MNLSSKSEIVDQIEVFLTELTPTVTMREMYGGVVIETISGNPKTRIGGYFVYEHYITLEFTNGVALNDPNKHLEGSGKKRRHLKIKSTKDFEAKGCSGFIHQALKNLSAA